MHTVAVGFPDLFISCLLNLSLVQKIIIYLLVLPTCFHYIQMKRLLPANKYSILLEKAIAKPNEA